MNFLAQRMCSCWNKLPSKVVEAGTLNEFEYLILILHSTHCYMTKGLHGILVRDWMPGLCMHGLLVIFD